MDEATSLCLDRRPVEYAGAFVELNESKRHFQISWKLIQIAWMSKALSLERMRQFYSIQ
jgi:hypothetical protein